MDFADALEFVQDLRRDINSRLGEFEEAEDVAKLKRLRQIAKSIATKVDESQRVSLKQREFLISARRQVDALLAKLD